MIPHKLKIIRKLESCKNQREVVAACSIGSSAVCTKKQKDNSYLL
jgi:hypothetical protein